MDISSNENGSSRHTLMMSASLIRQGTASSRVQKRLISSTLSFPGNPALSFLNKQQNVCRTQIVSLSKRFYTSANI